MTSAHSMFAHRLRSGLRPVGLVLLGSLSLFACNSTEKLTTPAALASPYDRPQLWAVVPFNNESGVSVVKTDRVADIFAEQTEAIDGVSAIPVNRVLTAMHRLDLRAVSTPADAKALMTVLGVDGLIVGTVTSYNPYPPMKMGAAVQLYRREATAQATSLDPVQITRASNDHAMPTAANEPVAQASGVFDASNHQTLAWLDDFTTGRSEPNSAYGKRIYLANMEMYTQFVAYRLLHDLLAVEQSRLHPQATLPHER